MWTLRVSADEFERWSGPAADNDDAWAHMCYHFLRLSQDSCGDQQGSASWVDKKRCDFRVGWRLRSATHRRTQGVTLIKVSEELWMITFDLESYSYWVAVASEIREPSFLVTVPKPTNVDTASHLRGYFNDAAAITADDYLLSWRPYRKNAIWVLSDRDHCRGPQAKGWQQSSKQPLKSTSVEEAIHANKCCGKQVLNRLFSVQTTKRPGVSWKSASWMMPTMKIAQQSRITIIRAIAKEIMDSFGLKTEPERSKVRVMEERSAWTTKMA